MRPHRLILFSLGLYLLFLGLSSGWFLSHDASARLVVARQLWQKHSFFIDGPRPERFVTTKKGKTTYFGIGQSLIFIPFDRVGHTLGKIPGLNAEMVGFVQTLPFIFLYAPLVGILWWLALLLLQRGLKTRLDPYLTGALFLLTTIALPYIAQSMQEEALIGALVALAYALFLDGRKELAVLSGFVAGCCFLFRLNSLFALLPLAGLWLDQKRRSFPLAFVLGTLPPFSLLIVTNTLRFGNPFSTGYDFAYAELASLGIKTWQPIRWDVALALLFGIGKGLFPLSPILAVSIYGLYRRYVSNRYFVVSALLSLVGSAVLYSRLWGYSCGGYSWGSRFHVHFLSVLFIPFVWGLQELRRPPRALFIVSFAIQILACSAPDALEYLQERVRLGDYHERLVVGFSDGQLPMRVKNITQWAMANPLSSETAAPHVLEGYRKNYILNLWGVSYSRLLGNSGPLILWVIQILVGGVLLAEMSARHISIPSLKHLFMSAKARR